MGRSGAGRLDTDRRGNFLAGRARPGPPARPQPGCPARTRRPARPDRAGWRRTRRRPPPARAGPAASPAAPAPSARRPRRPRPRPAGSASSAPQLLRPPRPAGRRRRRAASDLGQHGLQRLRLPGQRPQHVQRDDVAGALPDRVQRRLAVAAAASRTPRRTRCRPGTPAPRPTTAGPRLHTQYFADRAWPAGGSCPSVAGVASAPRPAAAPSTVAASRLDRQVGQHVAHQRLVDAAARRTPAGAARGARPGASAARISAADAEHAVEPGHRRPSR